MNDVIIMVGFDYGVWKGFFLIIIKLGKLKILKYKFSKNYWVNFIKCVLNLWFKYLEDIGFEYF